MCLFCVFQKIHLGVVYLESMAFFYILPGLTNRLLKMSALIYVKYCVYDKVKININENS